MGNGPLVDVIFRVDIFNLDTNEIILKGNSKTVDS